MNDGDARQLIWRDAVSQATAIREKRVSATALLEAYLDRIERFDPVLRAFVTVDVDGARAAARAADWRTAGQLATKRMLIRS